MHKQTIYLIRFCSTNEYATDRSKILYFLLFLLFLYPPKEKKLMNREQVFNTCCCNFFQLRRQIFMRLFCKIVYLLFFLFALNVIALVCIEIICFCNYWVSSCVFYSGMVKLILLCFVYYLLLKSTFVREIHFLK